MKTLKQAVFTIFFFLFSITLLSANIPIWRDIFYDPCINFDNWDNNDWDIGSSGNVEGFLMERSNNDRLILLKSIDLSETNITFARLSLEYAYDLPGGAKHQNLNIRISNNDGATWSSLTPIFESVAGGGEEGPILFNYVIPKEYFTENFKFRLVLSGNWNRGGLEAAIANIRISIAEQEFTGDIIYVDDDNTDGPHLGTLDYPFETITDALNFASITPDSYFIYVFDGIYNENIDINSEVILMGESKNNTIINGGGSGTVVNITSDNVFFANFRVTGSGNGGTDYGINLNASKFSYITESIITGNNIGINFSNSSSNQIFNNYIISNNTGIQFLSHEIKYNLIYNNYFDNTTQFSDVNSHITNYFNLEIPEPGKNIIGGDTLGGNYWSDYTGTLSDNGFGADPYPVSSRFDDNFPLTTITGADEKYYIHIQHDGEAVINQNEPITISIKDFADSNIVQNYNRTVFISTNGDADNLTWTNSTGSGSLTTDANGIASYNFLPSDLGSITLYFQYSEVDTIYFSAWSTTPNGTPINEIDSAPLFVNYPRKFEVNENYDATTPGWQFTHFDNITDAINAVILPNSIIYVYEGTYNEHIVVNKDDLEILGKGQAKNTIIDRGGGDSSDSPVVYVSSNNVTINNFTITGSSRWGGDNGHGIILENTNNVTISNNIITGNNIGILLRGGDSNEISSNYIKNPRDDGNAKRGLVLNNSPENCLIYNNYFDHVNQYRIISALKTNFFNLPDTITGTNIIGGPFLGGNFWADYSGGANPDGFGTLPYELNNNNIDYYPLVWTKAGTLSLEIEEKDYYIAGKIYTLSVTVKDDTGNTITDFNGSVKIRQSDSTADVFYINPNEKNEPVIFRKNGDDFEDITINNFIDGVAELSFYYNDAGEISFRVYNSDSFVYSNTVNIKFIPEYFEVEIHDYNPANIEIAGNYFTFTVSAKGSSDGPGTNELLENFNSTINFTPVYEEPDTGIYGFSQTSSSISNGVAIVSLYYPDAGEIRIHVEDFTYHQDTKITGTSEILTFRPYEFNIDIEYWGSRNFFYKCEFFRNVKITAVNIYDTKTPNYRGEDIEIVGIDFLGGVKLWGDTFVFDASDSGLKEIKFKFFSETSGIYHLTVKDEINIDNICSGAATVEIKKATLKLYDVSGRAGDTVTVQVKMIDAFGNIITEDNHTRFTVSGIHSPDLITKPDSSFIDNERLLLNHGETEFFISSKYDTTVFAEPVLNTEFNYYPKWHSNCTISDSVEGGYISFTQTKLKVIDSWLHVNNISTPDTLIARVKLLDQFNNKVKWGLIEPLRYSIILPDHISDSYILISDTDDLKIGITSFFDTFVIVRKANATLETFQIAPVTSQANPDTGTIQFLDRPRNIRIFYKQERGGERR